MSAAPPLERDFADLLAALAAAGAGAPREATGLTVADLATPGVVFQMGLPPRRIPVIERDALARNKRATGRAKDLADLEILEKG